MIQNRDKLIVDMAQYVLALPVGVLRGEDAGGILERTEMLLASVKTEVDAHRLLGLCRMTVGDWIGACAHFRDAVQAGDMSSVAHMLEASIRLGDEDEQTPELEEFATLLAAGDESALASFERLQLSQDLAWTGEHGVEELAALVLPGKLAQVSARLALTPITSIEGVCAGVFGIPDGIPELAYDVHMGVPGALDLLVSEALKAQDAHALLYAAKSCRIHDLASEFLPDGSALTDNPFVNPWRGKSLELAEAAAHAGSFRALLRAAEWYGHAGDVEAVNPFVKAAFEELGLTGDMVSVLIAPGLAAAWMCENLLEELEERDDGLAALRVVRLHTGTNAPPLSDHPRVLGDLLMREAVLTSPAWSWLGTNLSAASYAITERLGDVGSAEMPLGFRAATAVSDGWPVDDGQHPIWEHVRDALEQENVTLRAQGEGKFCAPGGMWPILQVRCQSDGRRSLVVSGDLAYLIPKELELELGGDSASTVDIQGHETSANPWRLESYPDRSSLTVRFLEALVRVAEAAPGEDSLTSRRPAQDIFGRPILFGAMDRCLLAGLVGEQVPRIGLPTPSLAIEAEAPISWLGVDTGLRGTTLRLEYEIDINLTGPRLGSAVMGALHSVHNAMLFLGHLWNENNELFREFISAVPIATVFAVPLTYWEPGAVAVPYSPGHLAVENYLNLPGDWANSVNAFAHIPSVAESESALRILDAASAWGQPQSLSSLTWRLCALGRYEESTRVFEAYGDLAAKRASELTDILTWPHAWPCSRELLADYLQQVANGIGNGALAAYAVGNVKRAQTLWATSAARGHAEAALFAAALELISSGWPVSGKSCRDVWESEYAKELVRWKALELSSTVREVASWVNSNTLPMLTSAALAILNEEFGVW